MAAEEEILSVTMDNGQAKQALSELNTALDKTGKAANDAADDLNKFGAASDNAGNATERKVVRLKEADRTYEGMLKRIPGTTEALQKYSQIQQRASIDLANGRIQQETYNRVIEEASNKYVRAAQAMSQATTAQRAAMQASANAAVASTLNVRNAIGQMSMQVQDISVQLAGGQNPFLVIAQQGSQMAGAFGPAGAAIGALIAIAGGAAMALGNLGSETAAMDKAAKSADATTEALSRTMGTAASSADDLAKKYKRLGAEMRAVEAVALMSAQRKIMEEGDDLRKSVEAQVKALESRRKEFELSQRQIDSGAKMDPKNVDKFAVMRDTFKAIDDFRKNGSIEALTVQLNKLGALGGDTAEPLNTITDALVGSAKRSGELAEQTKFVEAQMRLLNGTATEADKRLINLNTTTGETAKKARTLADVLGDVEQAMDHATGKDVAKAWDLVNDVMKEAETPAERYRKKVTQVQGAIDLLQKHADSLGDGLKAFSPAQIDAITEALRKQDPAFEAAKKAAEKYQQDVARVATDVGKDISENLWDQITGEAKAADAFDFFKRWMKRLAVEMLNQNLILPVTMQIVGAMPSLFGIQAPANQNGVASSGGSLTGSATNWLAGKAVSYGADKLGLSGIGTSIAGSIDSFGASALGIGVTPQVGAHGMLVGGGATSSATAPAGAAYGLSSYLGAGLAGVGAGSLVGGYLGTLSNSKAVGGLSGAASGALAGFLVGGPWGALIGGIGGGLGGRCGDRPTEGRTVAANVNFQMENAA